jgi:hypothetical protein
VTEAERQNVAAVLEHGTNRKAAEVLGKACSTVGESIKRVRDRLKQSEKIETQSNTSYRRHLMIPDAQVKDGVPTEHLEALGHYIVEKQPDVIVNIGDFADMPSLSSYEKPGSKYFEGKRYTLDVHSTRKAMERLLKPMKDYNASQAAKGLPLYKPEMHLTLGNHCNRIDRAIAADPVRLDGVISVDDLGFKDDWIVHDFLKPVEIDGILYCHYFVNTLSLKKSVIGGTMDNKLQKIGQSFSMGHQQILQYGMRYLNSGKCHHGLVAGAFYMHDEDYMSFQGNHHWRGVVMKNEVADGEYDPCFVSLDFLLRKYL